jgi:hypothetical protein
MTTFVALGDSITLGIGDRGPARAWRGWAALLAEGLREPRLHTCAGSRRAPPWPRRDQHLLGPPRWAKETPVRLIRCIAFVR